MAAGSLLQGFSSRLVFDGPNIKWLAPGPYCDAVDRAGLSDVSWPVAVFPGLGDVAGLVLSMLHDVATNHGRDESKHENTQENGTQSNMAVGITIWIHTISRCIKLKNQAGQQADQPTHTRAQKHTHTHMKQS